MPQTATYIYCLVEQKRRPSLAKVPPGLPGASPPDIIDLGRSLWAVAAEVPLRQYGTDRLEERLKNINWVADVALAHEAVVERFASRAGAAVVPMKLFTMFSSRERAVADLRGKIRGCRRDPEADPRLSGMGCARDAALRRAPGWRPGSCAADEWNGVPRRQGAGPRRRAGGVAGGGARGRGGLCVARSPRASLAPSTTP